MGRNLGFLLCLCSLFVGLAVADWNILNQRIGKNTTELKITLKNYCKAWRINVELHNIRNFEIVPEECTDYIGKYMSSTQFTVDSEKALEESTIYLSSTFKLTGDGKDAWVFDVDDALLSTVPYFKKHSNGGEKFNIASFEEWVWERNAPALEHTMNLFKEIKGKGLKIFLISSRGEHLRDPTTDNLFKVDFTGWSGLILRKDEDNGMTVQEYKAEQRKKLINEGYRIWGMVGSQWPSLLGFPSAMRTFKLPNSLYYIP
ncbi:acid phosphatase 1-like [Telopea speciosissima]|uniref:acid phosphatase 1-like n=1 Tax=Telopea speciosissima TaxID=54955 RepID=UPI001CC50A61|nr:acid phosphatase 1-like [Telopea speciosissima]XP_043707312.1 acid phosphatase 1-like [Telopea speciosissima]